MNLDSSPHTILKKINTRWIRILNTKGKTTKLLEENMGEYLHNLGVGKEGLTRMKVKNGQIGASLVAQWLRICLPMQGTWV